MVILLLNVICLNYIRYFSFAVLIEFVPDLFQLVSKCKSRNGTCNLMISSQTHWPFGRRDNLNLSTAHLFSLITFSCGDATFFLLTINLVNTSSTIP